MSKQAKRARRQSARAKKRREAWQRRAEKWKPGRMHSIPSFCQNNNISEPLYFSLKRRGLGPRETQLGDRTVITPEAEADWRREREAETQAARARKATAAEANA
jgi:hypothetical protein